MFVMNRWIVLLILLCVPDILGCGINSQKPQIVSPKTYYEKFQQAKAIKNESRARVIGEAFLDGYCLDNNETLPIYNTWQNNIKSYVPVRLTNEIGNYEYSSSLSGKKLSQISNWASTKLLESKAKGPDGRVVVVYLDGHTERQ